MPMYDFSCECGNTFEALVKLSVETLPCTTANCASLATRDMPAPKMFSTIIPIYPGSKRLKAGTVHTHGDRPKTPGKIQVGYTGGGSES